MREWANCLVGKRLGVTVRAPSTGRLSLRLDAQTGGPICKSAMLMLMDYACVVDEVSALKSISTVRICDWLQ